MYFLENAKAPLAALRANLKALGITQGAEVVERAVKAGLERLEAAGVVCDFLFLDPPYDHAAAYADALDFLGQSRLLKPTTLAVAEHSKHFDPGACFGALTRYRQLQQGDAVLSFYKLA